MVRVLTTRWHNYPESLMLSKPGAISANLKAENVISVDVLEFRAKENDDTGAADDPPALFFPQVRLRRSLGYSYQVEWEGKQPSKIENENYQAGGRSVLAQQQGTLRAYASPAPFRAVAYTAQSGTMMMRPPHNPTYAIMAFSRARLAAHRAAISRKGCTMYCRRVTYASINRAS
jgi:hypothetical protein